MFSCSRNYDYDEAAAGGGGGGYWVGFVEFLRNLIT